MFNISWPTVQIVSNRPYHSTASCAQQIFNMPSQGNLNENYTCDNYKNLFPAINGSGGQYSLSADFMDQLKSSPNQFDDADLILASIDSNITSLLDEILSVTSLTENEKFILKYNYYYRKSDFADARLNITQFAPAGDDEADFKALRIYDLDIIENGWDMLTADDLNYLNLVKDKGSSNSNFAITLLNNSSTYRDHLFDVVELPDVAASADVKHIENASNILTIRPNPATDKVYIDFIPEGASESDIRVFDVSGKLVTNYNVNYLMGNIELDIRNLNEGFYFVSITDPTSGIVRAGKLIKVKPAGQ
jgi:hypothetical protein